MKEHDERRNEIINTAAVLFMEKGYDRCSINDILNKIGIAKGTFYHYFKSKEDVLDAAGIWDIILSISSNIVLFVVPSLPARFIWSTTSWYLLEVKKLADEIKNLTGKVDSGIHDVEQGTEQLNCSIVFELFNFVLGMFNWLANNIPDCCKFPWSLWAC